MSAVPAIPGFEVTREDGQWVARAVSFTRELRGRTAAELHAARAAAARADLEAIRRKMATTDPSGYPRSTIPDP